MNPEVYEYYKSHHICTNCGNADAVRGETLCPDCRELNRARGLRWYHNLDDEAKQAESAKKKQRREDWKTTGKCQRCGHPLETWSKYKSCETCRAKMRRYYENNRKPETLPAVLRNSYEYCYLCCKPIDRALNSKLCDKCRQICITNLSKITPEARERANQTFREYNKIYWNGVIHK